MGLFDVHAHLTSPRFAEDVDQVVARAIHAGVSCIISNGLNLDDNRAVLDLARRYPGLIRPALGLYPVDAVLNEMLALGVDYPREDAAIYSVSETITHIEAHASEIVAIGEIGLDHHWVPESLWEAQERAFLRLLGLARDLKRPAIVHTRKAEQRTLELLLEAGHTKINWHCFSSRLKLAERIATAGHYLSVPANARRNETFTALLKTIPRDRLLLETDCPYLGPEPKTRNEPANVARTVNYAAELWGINESAALDQFESNFEALFGFRP